MEFPRVAFSNPSSSSSSNSASSVVKAEELPTVAKQIELLFRLAHSNFSTEEEALLLTNAPHLRQSIYTGIQLLNLEETPAVRLFFMLVWRGLYLLQRRHKDIAETQMFHYVHQRMISEAFHHGSPRRATYTYKVEDLVGDMSSVSKEHLQDKFYRRYRQLCQGLLERLDPQQLEPSPLAPADKEDSPFHCGTPIACSLYLQPGLAPATLWDDRHFVTSIPSATVEALKEHLWTWLCTPLRPLEASDIRENWELPEPGGHAKGELLVQWLGLKERTYFETSDEDTGFEMPFSTSLPSTPDHSIVSPYLKRSNSIPITPKRV